MPSQLYEQQDNGQLMPLGFIIASMLLTKFNYNVVLGSLLLVQPLWSAIITPFGYNQGETSNSNWPLVMNASVFTKRLNHYSLIESETVKPLTILVLEIIGVSARVY